MPSPTTSSENLAAVFKAYDVRGTVPDQLDESLAYATGMAFVAELGASALVVGYDMRPSSPGLAGAFADGATEAGADVTMIGLASTDQLYFASGHLGLPGAMFTASHNPAQYNGIKMCRELAQPVGMDSGLAAIRDRVAAGASVRAGSTGSIGSHDVLQAYAAHLLSLAPVRGRRLKVVVDAGNGMAGHTAPAVFGRLEGQVDLVPMYFELDGTFPNHEANPIEPENLVDLQRRVVAERADIGLAFDGDADRCFIVDERGRAVSPSTLTALIASRELAKEPGATVIHNLITSRAVPEIVGELGGVPVRTRVGHSFIKATMAETEAIFGGEHSGHFYFRDFWRADSGMLAALHALAALAETDRPLSELMAAYERYPLSGEINSTVADQAAVLAALEERYAGADGVVVDHLDGLSVSHADWAFNVRASNTEPLLRLNAEGKDEATMATVRDDVLEIIRSGK
ncbi:phosphomannomutase/phosphoglucomutase [Nocardioides sp. GY 10113]|uniref:phosphomannomutase/phosphoglucomutase n=1 Tax=Nocardioides sp. GY 10113 TaxID=2569761 RepID=UPI0010A8050E|nr:phosphomannomutase/phosphoglucomutase [Nocardioides sp. GY 10113]TIC87912.1 phosphomannomutase/phosphoglucomutase [Nocardioides sp. GY 10113]